MHSLLFIPLNQKNYLDLLFIETILDFYLHASYLNTPQEHLIVFMPTTVLFMHMLHQETGEQYPQQATQYEPWGICGRKGHSSFLRLTIG